MQAPAPGFAPVTACNAEGRQRTRKLALTQRYAPKLMLLPGPWIWVFSIDSANRPIARRSAPRQLLRPGTAAAAAQKAADGMLARTGSVIVLGGARQTLTARWPPQRPLCKAVSAQQCAVLLASHSTCWRRLL